MLVDMAYAGELSNSITRPQNVTMAQFDVGSSLFEGDELSDLRSEDAMLRPGDLVELRYRFHRILRWMRLTRIAQFRRVKKTHARGLPGTFQRI